MRQGVTRPENLRMVNLLDIHVEAITHESLKEYDRVGRMLLKRGMLDEAVQVFKKALKIDAGTITLVTFVVFSAQSTNEDLHALAKDGGENAATTLSRSMRQSPGASAAAAEK